MQRVEVAHRGESDQQAPLRRDLTALFSPSSIAVVGASNDRRKWGHDTARRALQGEHRRRVYLVNNNAGTVLGRPAFPTVAALPEPPDLVVVTVGASAFEEVIDDALQAGAKAIVVISAGLGETGESGARRERAARDRVRAAGAVLMGPNCLGVFDAEAELEINPLTHGSIGIISQSGNFALELDQLATNHGIGFSRFASLGNQADLELAEVLVDFAHHEPTRLIAVYCEDFRDGRGFTRAAQEAVDRGKPVLLLDAGRSAAGNAAARSHTGALLSGSRAVQAACRAAGIQRVASPRELVDLAAALLSGARVRGRRLGVLTDGGGNGVIACDLAADAGFEVPPLSGSLRSSLTQALSPSSPTANPVDVADAGPKDYWSYERAARLLAASGEVDCVLMTGFFGGYSRSSDSARDREVGVANGLGGVVKELGISVVAQTMHWSSEPASALRVGGVPVYRDIDAAVAALRRLAERDEQRPVGTPELPPAEPPVWSGQYFQARRLLESAGIAFAPAREVRSIDEARASAAQIGYPVVLKAIGDLHKSDAGGVVLGIADADELARAFAEITSRLSPESCSVERMVAADRGVELLIGARRDPRFGPIVLVGFGGVFAELHDDVRSALAPIDERGALDLIRTLRGSKLLGAGRDRPPLQIGDAAAALAALSRLAAAHPEIGEVEVNPLIVTPERACAVDARLVISPRRTTPEDGWRMC